MSNINYGYPTSNNSSFNSSFSSHYSSTPASNTRYRSRFAHSGPPSYPRPRSSASKPNPDSYLNSSSSMDYQDKMSGIDSPSNLNSYQDGMSGIRDYAHGYSDSMRNNYGDSTMNNSLAMSAADAFSNSLVSGNTSSYYTGNESFYQNQPLLPGYQNEGSSYGYANRGHSSYGTNNYRQNEYYNSNAGEQPAANARPTAGFDTNAGSFGANNRGQTSGRGSYRGGRAGKKNSKGAKSGPGYIPYMNPKPQYHCSSCAMDFTSQIPLEMHLRGAKHAKKLKARTSLSSIQGLNSQVKEVDKPDGKKYVCEICNIIANSALQLQMHLEGTKHKAKVEGPNDESKDGSKSNKAEVNGKSNGGVVRSLPSDFGEPQQTKLMKFSCDICNVIVNSDVQLQQHLTSKKHQAKVEGKPIVKKKKAPKQEGEAQSAMDESTNEGGKPELTNVVGVKTLSTSFIQGGTLQ